MGYVFADLPRHGLGNILFPWSRAVVYQETYALTLIPARWSRLRLGPYRRGDADKRKYGQLFARQGPVVRMSRVARLRGLDVLDELDPASDHAKSVRIFTGMRDFFGPLNGKREIVLNALTESVREPRWFANTSLSPYVALHVRLGDFGRNQPLGSRNAASPMAWYEGAISAVRDIIPNVPILVCSDGSDSELQPLLKWANVSRTQGANPIEDLATLMHSVCVFGSGSTFSAWASFLGNTPMVVEPGQNHYLPGVKVVRESAASSLARNLSELLSSLS